VKWLEERARTTDAEDGSDIGGGRPSVEPTESTHIGARRAAVRLGRLPWRGEWRAAARPAGAFRQKYAGFCPRSPCKRLGAFPVDQPSCVRSINYNIVPVRA
jgi:hypothetical protein